ncbi:alpha-ketoglutarate-dependent dioxygenase AlkB [Mucilaginibacter hurinus]|uniref:Alpha-ketoglutarate-dependent dioxygenase AlkB n=1 Tax=Mucilaginibacter hurinus TaxID=2201324 RepID=A0A367GU66_9SPHI|nr:alpha-ketoglutarate-dependent dioxygenase AlkB [Mucilaginibacter hurinus]RCH56341.1 alpha-ketoglutarate-dependent dioxygenase AlkB [Mucilaginibacter hurinus]
MEQIQLFAEAGQSRGLPKHLLEYQPALYGSKESDTLLQFFINNTPWQQTTQTLWHKQYLTPRLTCWYGETDRIAGLLPWTPELQAIREKVEPLAGISFNCVLLNYYRNGNDSVAWHSDKESVLGSQPTIASVSFGQVRSFDIRNKHNHAEKYSVRLEHGSFLLMKGSLQEDWHHRIAKSARPMKPRVNLTFRRVV